LGALGVLTQVNNSPDNYFFCWNPSTPFRCISLRCQSFPDHPPFKSN